MTGPADPAGETFDEFRNSFSYGSRNDLSFKFMSRLDSNGAAEFLRLVLHEIGEAYDSGSMDALVDLVYEWQVKAYTPPPGSERPYVYDDRPFAPLPTPLSVQRRCRQFLRSLCSKRRSEAVRCRGHDSGRGRFENCRLSSCRA